MVLHAHQQYAAAERCYRRAEALDVRSARWSYYLATVLAAQGKQSEALEGFQRALRRDPGLPVARRQIAEMLLGMARPEEAERWAREAVGNAPNAAAGWYVLGRIQASRRDTDTAVASLRKACELFPRYGRARHALGLCLRLRGETREADEQLRLAERQMQDSPPPDDPFLAELGRLRRDAAGFLREGAELGAQGKLPEAVAAHLAAIAADPRLAQAHSNLISLYAKLGQPEKAEEHYRAAVKLNPDQAEAHYDWGVVEYSRTRLREANTAFQLALEANPSYPEAHNNLGYLLEGEGKPAEAEQHYRKAVESQPRYRLARFHLGRLMLNQRRYGAAIEQLQQTLEPEDENTPGYRYALGTAYGRSGNRTRALELIRMARSQAAALGQDRLVASMDKDLQLLEQRK
jgi:tetratricopeptide (TPR) repeat protein